MAGDVLSETELGSRACAGDAQALAALLERNQASLYASAMRLLGSRADALDAVQDTSLIALARGERAARLRRRQGLASRRHPQRLPDAAAATARASYGEVEPAGTVTDPEEALAQHALREWVWRALETLPAEEQLAVILRYFSRCESYNAIARLTAVPIGTVRSRLNRGRARLGNALMETISGSPGSRSRLEAQRREEWAGFYRTLHDHPTPRTYRELFAGDVDVSDRNGNWVGVPSWSAHERDAIELGVRATIVGLLASRSITVIEIDFANPAAAPGHCPPQATFVHRLERGRSAQLRIHYPPAGF